jgi:hypothetical protein
MGHAEWAVVAMVLGATGAMAGRCWAAEPKTRDKPKPPSSPSPAWTVVVGDDRFYEDEYTRIRDDISRTRSGVPDELTPAPVADRRSLIWETDGDPLDVVLRRTKDLAGQLSVQERAANGTTIAARLLAISDAAQKSSGKGERESARHALYLETFRLRRTIALMNPLLDFDDIVFMPSAAGIGGPLQVSGYAKNTRCLSSYGPVVVS